MLLILFCVLTKHLWVLKKTVKRVRAFPMELEFELANGFEERGKTGVPEENLSEQLERTNNKLNPHYGVDAKTGFKPQLH